MSMLHTYQYENSFIMGSELPDNSKNKALHGMLGWAYLNLPLLDVAVV
jgi:hypothetical protein